MSDHSKDVTQYVEAGFWPIQQLDNEQRLLLAVIERAMQDAYDGKALGVESYARYAHLRLKIANQAKAWLLSQEYRPFSFRWCCDMLNVHPCVITSMKRHVG